MSARLRQINEVDLSEVGFWFDILRRST